MTKQAGGVDLTGFLNLKTTKLLTLVVWRKEKGLRLL